MSVDLLQNTPKTRKPIAERTSHGWHGYTTRGCSSLCCTKQLLLLPRNARNTRNLLAEKSLPQMSTDIHRLGGYGIPAISTLPNSVFCWRTAHHNNLCPSVGEKIFPQNARNTRNLLAEKSLPQMSTDVHRLGGYGIPAISTLPNSVFCWRTAHSKHLCKSVPSVGEKIFPQNARNTRNLLAEKSLLQMNTAAWLVQQRQVHPLLNDYGRN